MIRKPFSHPDDNIYGYSPEQKKELLDNITKGLRKAELSNTTVKAMLARLEKTAPQWLENGLCLNAPFGAALTTLRQRENISFKEAALSLAENPVRLFELAATLLNSSPVSRTYTVGQLTSAGFSAEDASELTARMAPSFPSYLSTNSPFFDFKKNIEKMARDYGLSSFAAFRKEIIINPSSLFEMFDMDYKGTVLNVPLDTSAEPQKLVHIFEEPSALPAPTPAVEDTQEITSSFRRNARLNGLLHGTASTRAMAHTELSNRFYPVKQDKMEP